MNVPVLNVIYDPSPTACGPTFRDWLNELIPFQANNVVSPGYAEPTVPPVTVCDNPGADVGTFQGVAVEKLSDKLIFTSQMQAGWYRYIMKVTFYLNGDIEPQFGFTAISDPCIFEPHKHHGYWRFDFDVDGAANDIVQERQDFGIPVNFSKETTRLRDYTVGRRWAVQDKNTRRGVEVFPGPNDGVGGDRFGGPDLWALLYHSDEKDDGGYMQLVQNPMAQHISPYVNGEVIKSQDVVLWYRIGHYHASGPQCMLLGPKIHLFGNW
jgi:Cu2+-containing amine oxidase